MEQLTALLEQATANLPFKYFQVELDGGDPLYRERVYCYELYHQLRCLWPEATPFSLNGELDKAAHPILQKLGADYAKPDLLVHTLGHMGGNHAIVEVKSAKAPSRGIQKDLRTLALFRTAVGYQRAIYLIFGYESDQAAARVKKVAAKLPNLPPVELWVHPKHGAPAFCTALLQH